MEDGESVEDGGSLQPPSDGGGIEQQDDKDGDIKRRTEVGHEEMINLDAALEMMEGDQEILNSVVEAFVTEAPGLLDQLDQALQAGDLPTTLRAAHTLKGNFRILKLQNQQAMWEKIEHLARAEKPGEIAELVGPAREKTLDALGQLQRFLDQHG